MIERRNALPAGRGTASDTHVFMRVQSAIYLSDCEVIRGNILLHYKHVQSTIQKQNKLYIKKCF